MTALPSVCIIGAGSSGIAAAKSLHERGIAVDVFEKSDKVGGNWVFQNKNGMSSSYRTLHINTSRERMEYADFPMPKHYPDFPHHTHIAEYFNDYVDHFGIRERIHFNEGVEHAARGEDGVWEVTLEGGEQRRYDALVVANGHHWDPRWPEPGFPGSDSFAGQQIHSHHYTDPEQLRDKRVVVLGMGNSAMDIAVDASYSAAATFLASRRGAHVIPKYIFGKPIDQIGASPHIPFPVRATILRVLLRLYQGQMERYGLPRPDHRFGEAHPTISGRILDRLAHGAIAYRPNIAALEGHDVRFVDGTVEKDIDLVIYCTGYKVTFPFFEDSFISAPDNDLPLYRRTFHPEIENLAFVGLFQPLGAIMPAAERQGKWVAQYLRGEYAVPPAGEMRADMEAERAQMFKRYVASPRHTMQVDYDDFMLAMEKEMAAGAERARQQGFPLPVSPRAAEQAAVAA
ncbi:MAG: flavin-containing monooxygenase [Solirubrobacteraceae bacterium]|nr:MAG: monooxygenase [Solirubrobacterales bacterium]